MLRDVFYYGEKPNVHPREKFAKNLEHARSQATTDHFWIINEFCDYTGFDWDFDFEFLPDEDVWAEDHNNVWPSQHQKDSGTWLCPKELSEIIIYRNDVDPVRRKNEITKHWVFLEDIDKSSFDFSWHPDPTDPPYIYKWGCKFFPVELKSCLEYHVENATEVKYMQTTIGLLPNDYWVEVQTINRNKFDLTWRPDPRDPAYIYIWGNKYIDATLKSTLEYHCPGATEIKYMPEILDVEIETDRWTEYTDIDKTKFDLKWRPDPREPAYIYVWGNKYEPAEVKPTLEYKVPGATEIKYMPELLDVLPEYERWNEYTKVLNFDFTWRPDPKEPPFIYVWGNKYEPADIKPTLEYVVPGATEIKYMSNDIEVEPQYDRWTEHVKIDRTKFDLSWRPDPREPAYIYVWGNKYESAEIKPTLSYKMPGATEIKYMGDNVEVLPEFDKWDIIQKIDYKSFDFTWRPDPREPDYIYVWGNKWVSGEIKPTLKYTVPGATEYKYMDEPVIVLPETERWITYETVKDFDYTWRPNPTSPPYVYVWGNKWIAGELRPTIEYHMPGATQRKYMEEPVELLPISENWKVYQETLDFDYSWRPDPREPDYIYVWGNEFVPAELKPTIEYYCPNATERKYMGNVRVAPEWDKWKFLIPVDRTSFDFSWRPDPREPAFIYVWGNTYNESEREPTIEYHCEGATERKYINDKVVKTLPDMSKWKQLISVSEFDYSWRPDPKSPPYIYVFGNKWNDATIEPSLEYYIEGATEYKYVTDVVATPEVDLKYWSVNNTDDLDTFDFTWRPNPHSPPQIYQWEDNGPRYTLPGATDVVLMKRDGVNKINVINRYQIKTTLEDLILEHKDEVFWVINPDLNYDKFDFNWKPNEQNFRHINVFGNEYSKNTQTYYVNGPLYMMGYREFNYIEGQSIKVDSNLSMFFIDKSNVESDERYKQLKARYPQLIKTRYLNGWVDTINRCINKSQTKFFWVVSSELDYTDFEFDFYPSPWQEKMVHVFGTQWSHWGNTYFINGEAFPESTQYVKIIEHLNVLNFVKSKRAKAASVIYDIVYIDHGNSYMYPENSIVIKYKNSYLDTFIELLKILPQKKEHYIWVCSSVCDYSNFDFTYICDPFAKDQLHVFPSDKQKFGDTFLIDVNKLRTLIDDMTMLEDYEKINYNQHQRVNRLPAPTIVTVDDTLTNVIFENYDFPYAIFKTKDNENLNVVDTEPMNLWASDTKNIIITSTGATRVIVPQEAKNYIERELYDYPYINRSNKLIQSKPLDIVFLSNGEPGADDNYEHLLKVTKGLRNRIVRIDGVNGRVAAYHAAAEASETPWMFTVFAKLKVSDNFDWNWQPDRLQVPKHYVFTALNPVNKLIYGHQAMIAYNKKITLANNGRGLDFTLDNEHEVVDILSGVANFNVDAWTTWRTSFREALKLCTYPDNASQERLKIWTSVAEGDYATECLNGANDAVEYFDEVAGDYDELKLSYDWAWLREFYNKKYN